MIYPNTSRHLCYIGLGSNIKCPPRQIRQAIQSIHRLPRTYVKAAAPLYQNKALYRRGAPDYHNTVISIRTRITPHALMAVLLELEKNQGRVRKARYMSRTIDMDIIFYGHRTIKTPTLQVPHPHHHKRDFVRIPMEQLS